jgi:hypothetical protein
MATPPVYLILFSNNTEMKDVIFFSIKNTEISKRICSKVTGGEGGLHCITV